MAQTLTGLANANGCSVKVGTTGTIGSLMSRELESMKHMTQASGPSSLKHQSAPVSVPCGATPRRLQPRRSGLDEIGSSSGSSSTSIISNNSGSAGVIHKLAPDSQKPRQTPRKNRNVNRMPILTADKAGVESTQIKDKAEIKGSKGHSFLVEVVDLKCNNPMSGRLKKLGFSKLSESIA